MAQERPAQRVDRVTLERSSGTLNELLVPPKSKLVYREYDGCLPCQRATVVEGEVSRSDLAPYLDETLPADRVALHQQILSSQLSEYLARLAALHSSAGVAPSWSPRA